MMNCNRNSRTITNLYEFLIRNALVLIHTYLKKEIISAMSNAKIYFAVVESFFRI